MKTQLSYIMCISSIFVALFQSGGCTEGGDQTLSQQSANDPTATEDSIGDSTMKPFEELVSIRAKYAATIKPGIHKDYARNCEVMRQLLAEWNPIGVTRDQLLFVLGPPTTENNEADSLSYSFQNGYFGEGWRFVFDKGRVAKIVEYKIQ